MDDNKFYLYIVIPYEVPNEDGIDEPMFSNTGYTSCISFQLKHKRNLFFGYQLDWEDADQFDGDCIISDEWIEAKDKKAIYDMVVINMLNRILRSSTMLEGIVQRDSKASYFSMWSYTILSYVIVIRYVTYKDSRYYSNFLKYVKGDHKGDFVRGVTIHHTIMFPADCESQEENHKL